MLIKAYKINSNFNNPTVFTFFEILKPQRLFKTPVS